MTLVRTIITFFHTATQHINLSDHESLLTQGKGSHDNHVIDNYIAMLLLSDAQMWELTEFVAPKVMAEWESLAYCMRYSPEEVEAFRRDSKDLKECCKKLFGNWLTTAHGPKPKTYLTLLKHIKKIDVLTTASEAIEKELIKGKD